MLCLTAFNPTFCSWSLPSTQQPGTVPAASKFPCVRGMGWEATPHFLLQHPCSSSFLRTVTFEIGVFFTPSSVLRKETASLTLFTVPKVIEALVEEAGSTYSPTHPFQHGINQCSGCAPCISARTDPNTVIQD